MLPDDAQPAPPGSEVTTPTSRARVKAYFAGGSLESIAPSTDVGARTLRSGAPFPFVIVVIPSYNEEQSLRRTIGSLRAQSRVPDEIIVLADNCDDATVEVARSEDVSVWETKDNFDGKAGALNQLFASFLELLDDDDVVLVMDADTTLTETFIEATTEMLFTPSKKEIAGVGGIFLADDEEDWNLVRQLQSNEYIRYQRRLSRRGGRALVLTGTGTLFRASVLRRIQRARRAGEIPDLAHAGGVYDISALTEDNELTLSVKELGYRVVSPKACTVKTAMMPTWSSLYKQRRRWQRGALENLIAHGINRHTATYALRQIMTYIGVFFLPFYLHTLVVALSTNSELNFFEPLWVAVAVLYVAEQAFSVRKGGWKAIVVSLLVIPEFFLYAFLDVVYVVTFFGALFGTDEAWGRMRHLRVDTYNTGGKIYSEKTVTSHVYASHTRHTIHGRHSYPARSWTSPKKLANSLHGTHYVRQAPALRLVEELILLTIVVGVTAAIAIPFLSLELAWMAIAIYVLLGALATLGRLIPVRTF
jgi:cellulose synthase/poly-beta-1,6-N-acetylglucosamine synthase-like glycosyltransferase